MRIFQKTCLFFYNHGLKIDSFLQKKNKKVTLFDINTVMNVIDCLQ